MYIDIVWKTHTERIWFTGDLMKFIELNAHNLICIKPVI